MVNKGPSLDLWNEPHPFQNSQAYEQKNHNWNVLRNYGQYIGNYLKGITDAWEVRFAAQINQIPQPNEVIDARVDASGHAFPTLRAHLINIESTRLQYEESNYQGAGSNSLSIIVKVTDLSTSSFGLSYTPQGTAQMTLPRMGYMDCKVNDLMVSPD